MLTPLGVLTTYSVLLTLTPILVSSTAGVNANLVSFIAYHLNLHYRYNKIEPAILNVGFVTIYVYAVMEFISDMIQALEDRHRIRSRRESSYVRFAQARLQTRDIFPPFVISSFLIYVQTTKFDVLRDSFITLQSFIIVVYPVVAMFSEADIEYVLRCFYRSVLLWTIFYALLPREASYTIENILAIFYGIINYNDSYGNIQHWVY